MNDEDNNGAQRELCSKHMLEFVPSPPDSKLGIALQTLGQIPINGLRHLPTAETNGWYIWAGEFSAHPEFFAPLHAAHIPEKLPAVEKFLGLPPGTRFLIAGDYVEVWFDESLLIV